MGNRAFLKFDNEEGMTLPVGIYLHWNGGIESIVAFVDYFNEGMADRQGDAEYGLARLCQIIGNYFGGSLSLGLNAYISDEENNPGDNGVYHLQFKNSGLAILNREAQEIEEARRHSYWDNDKIMKQLRKDNDRFFKKSVTA